MLWGAYLSSPNNSNQQLQKELCSEDYYLERQFPITNNNLKNHGHTAIKFKNKSLHSIFKLHIYPKVIFKPMHIVLILYSKKQ